MTDTFLYDVSPGTKADVTHSVRAAKFGDGYSQFAKDGIHARNSTWSVEMVNLDDDTANEVADFFDRNAGRSFYWIPPRKLEQGRYLCSEYSITPTEYRGQSISATFEEVWFP